MKYKIALLHGDGIGPDIVNEAKKVLISVTKKFNIDFEFKEGLIGGAAIDKTGFPLPEETVELCKSCDAALLGAVGGPKWDSLEKSKRPEAGLLAIRSRLSLFANLRPAITFKPLVETSPLKNEILGDGLDILIIRELCGGIYFGKSGKVNDGNEDAAYDTEYYSVSEIERIARAAFEAAKKRGRAVTSVDKANVLESSRLWRATVNRIAQEYPEITLNHIYVDNAAMQLVRNPRQFDVILTSNIFGDILSDEAAMICGSIGMLPSASLSGGAFGLYEPVHGSAPDIAGTGKANPLATILSAAMMLRYSFNLSDAASAIESAVDKALLSARTADIADEKLKTVTTQEMGTLVSGLI